MLDLPSVKVTGAINIARARALYQDGSLRLYNQMGRIRTIVCTEPVPKKGWRSTWSAMTDIGAIVLKSRCSSCGGWRVVTDIPAEELWGTL